MHSVPIDERIAKLVEGIRGTTQAEELTSGLVRRAAKIVVEQMLDAEVGELLGRRRYERQAAGAGHGAPPGRDPGAGLDAAEASGAARRDAVCTAYRNGHKPRQLRTAEGKVPIDLPQVRGADGWSSPLWQSRLECRMLGNLHVRFGVGAGGQFPGPHYHLSAAYVLLTEERDG